MTATHRPAANLCFVGRGLESDAEIQYANYTDADQSTRGAQNFVEIPDDFSWGISVLRNVMRTVRNDNPGTPWHPDILDIAARRGNGKQVAVSN